MNWENITKEELESLFQQGLWHKDIAEQFGVSPRTVYTKVSKFGIELERKNAHKEKDFKICKRCGRKILTSKYWNQDLCTSCGDSLATENTFNSLENDITGIGSKIIELRKQGLSYSKISEQLKCSKSTVSYWCNASTRKDVVTRNQRNKEKEPWKYKLLDALDNFKRRKQGIGREYMDPNYDVKDWNKKFRTAVSEFNSGGKILENKYGYKDVIEAWGGTKVKCYLTGKEIDIMTDNYQLDHKVPIAKGGTNEISNMRPVLPYANLSKSDMTIEEYLDLCKTVLTNFGYKIEEPEDIKQRIESA